MFRINLNAKTLMSAFGAVELTRCGGMICPKDFLEFRLEDLIAFRADVIDALVVGCAEPN